MRSLLLGVALLALRPGAPHNPRTQAPGPLVLVDSVRLVESDTFVLARPVQVLAGPKGDVFIVDQRDARIARIDRRGRLVGWIGRSGAGPGEFRRPATMALSGDSLLSVWDLGLQRLSTWALRTGRPIAAFPLGGWFPQLGYHEGRLRVGVLHTDSTPTVMTVALTGEGRRGEGRRPPLFDRAPPLIAGFGSVYFADDGPDVYGVFEVADQLFHWRRGERAVSATNIPRRVRRGVRPDLFDELMRDPAKAAAIAYDRSIPQALRRLQPGVLGLITLDGTLEQGRNFVGTLRLSVIDVSRRRACVDLDIPGPRDPLPVATFAGDTLVVLRQGERPDGTGESWLLRYHVDITRCTWQGLDRATSLPPE